MQDFRKLAVWEKAHQLALLVYQLTGRFPSEERFGLTNQMRRASVSPPSNIAEGCGRGTSKELVRFLQIAMGSASELEYQLMLARDLQFFDDVTYEQVNADLIVMKRMLNSFIRTVQKTNNCQLTTTQRSNYGREKYPDARGAAGSLIRGNAP